MYNIWHSMYHNAIANSNRERKIRDISTQKDLKHTTTIAPCKNRQNSTAKTGTMTVATLISVIVGSTTAITVTVNPLLQCLFSCLLLKIHTAIMATVTSSSLFLKRDNVITATMTSACPLLQRFFDKIKKCPCYQ